MAIMVTLVCSMQVLRVQHINYVQCMGTGELGILELSGQVSQGQGGILISLGLDLKGPYHLNKTFYIGKILPS